MNEYIQTTLSLIKIQLGINHNAKNDYYIHIINSVIGELKKIGAIINFDDIEDINLIKDIAYFKVTTPTENDYPQHIKYRIKERKLRKRATNNGT